jgi:hypothetical protein
VSSTRGMWQRRFANAAPAANAVVAVPGNPAPPRRNARRTARANAGAGADDDDASDAASVRSDERGPEQPLTGIEVTLTALNIPQTVWHAVLVKFYHEVGRHLNLSAAVVADGGGLLEALVPVWAVATEPQKARLTAIAKEIFPTDPPLANGPANRPPVPAERPDAPEVPDDAISVPDSDDGRDTTGNAAVAGGNARATGTLPVIRFPLSDTLMLYQICNRHHAAEASTSAKGVAQRQQLVTQLNAQKLLDDLGVDGPTFRGLRMTDGVSVAKFAAAHGFILPATEHPYEGRFHFFAEGDTSLLLGLQALDSMELSTSKDFQARSARLWTAGHGFIGGFGKTALFRFVVSRPWHPFVISPDRRAVSWSLSNCQFFDSSSRSACQALLEEGEADLRHELQHATPIPIGPRTQLIQLSWYKHFKDAILAIHSKLSPAQNQTAATFCFLVCFFLCSGVMFTAESIVVPTLLPLYNAFAHYVDRQLSSPLQPSRSQKSLGSFHGDTSAAALGPATAASRPAYRGASTGASASKRDRQDSATAEQLLYMKKHPPFFVVDSKAKYQASCCFYHGTSPCPLAAPHKKFCGFYRLWCQEKGIAPKPLVPGEVVALSKRFAASVVVAD